MAFKPGLNAAALIHATLGTVSVLQANEDDSNARGKPRERKGQPPFGVEAKGGGEVESAASDVQVH